MLQCEKDHDVLDACQSLYKSKESNVLASSKCACLLTDHQSVTMQVEQQQNMMKSFRMIRIGMIIFRNYRNHYRNYIILLVISSKCWNHLIFVSS